MILTGPNMSGKSVFMRQAALLVILAQMGAFVPARSAPHRAGRPHPDARRAPRTIWPAGRARSSSRWSRRRASCTTRRRAASSSSTRSGRGTSTFDGLAIAWAVTEELHERGHGAKVLFATHYHELTALAERLPRVRNFHVAVKEWNDEIIFLHKVRPGGTDRSYGIQVARLAGLPAVRDRARPAILAELESEQTELCRRPRPRRRRAAEPAQLGLFPPTLDPILQELAALDVASLTPLQALNLLAEWQQRLQARP